MTGDLFIHQKNEAVRKFEESSRTLHEIISFQQEIYNKLDQQRQVTIDAQDDIDYVMQALVAQRDFVDQQKILISAINHVSFVRFCRFLGMVFRALAHFHLSRCMTKVDSEK